MGHSPWPDLKCSMNFAPLCGLFGTLSPWLRRSDRSFLEDTLFSGIQLFSSKHGRKKKRNLKHCSSRCSSTTEKPWNKGNNVHTPNRISALEFSSKPWFLLFVLFLRGTDKFESVVRVQLSDSVNCYWYKFRWYNAMDLHLKPVISLDFAHTSYVSEGDNFSNLLAVFTCCQCVQWLFFPRMDWRSASSNSLPEQSDSCCTAEVEEPCIVGLDLWVT